MANAVGDVWLCCLEWIEGEERGLICLHREVTVVYDSDEDVLGNALAAELVTLGDTVTTDMLGTGVVLVCATCQRLGATNPTRIYTKFSTGTASVGSTALPAQTCVLASVYPAAGSLIRSGRSYFPFLDEAKQSAGQILSASKTAIEDAVDPLILDLIEVTGAADLRAVLWRRVGELAVVITSSVLRPVLSTQPRRDVNHQPFQ